MFILLYHVMHASIVHCLVRVYCLCHVLSLYYRIVLSLVYCIMTYSNWFVGVYIYSMLYILCCKKTDVCALLVYFKCEGEAV